MAATIVAAPSLGASTMVATTYMAPMRPPVQYHQGVAVQAGPIVTGACKLKTIMTSPTVPTRNETSAAVSGEPTAERSWALIPAWTGRSTPAAIASISKRIIAVAV